MGETLKGGSYLDIEAELRLVDKKKRELRAEYATEEVEKLAMKRLGMKRWIHPNHQVVYSFGSHAC